MAGEFESRKISLMFVPMMAAVVIMAMGQIFRRQFVLVPRCRWSDNACQQHGCHSQCNRGSGDSTQH